MQNYYRILGLPNFSSIEEIKRTYKKLAKQYHPDRNPNNTFAEENFKEISNAYSTLSDSLKKRVYDDRLKGQLTPNPTPQRHTQYQKQAHPHFQTRYYKKSNEDIKKRKKKERKIYIFSTLIGLTFVVALLTFSHYMNLYSAKKYYKNALEYKDKGEFGQALLNLELARRYNTFDSEINELEGDLVIRERKAYNEALFYYTEAIAESKPIRYETVFKRAKTFMYLKRYNESIQEFEKVIEQKILEDSAYLYLGELFLKAKSNYLKAVHCFNQFETISPNSQTSTVLFNLRGYSRLQLGDFEQATLDFKKNIELEPNNGYSYYLLAQAYLRSNKYSEYCKEINNSARLGIKNAEKECKKYNCQCD